MFEIRRSRAGNCASSAISKSGIISVCFFVPLGLNRQAVPEGQSLYKGYSDAWKKCPWDEASCTIKENHGGVNLHPKLPRVLTAREMARLQSFPDDFIFEGKKNKQLVQIGNAVPPLLAKAIGLSIIQSIEEHYNK